VQVLTPHPAFPVVGGVLDKELVEEHRRIRDRRHAHAGFRPGKLAAPVYASFGADRKGGKPSLRADFVGNELVDRDVAQRAVGRFVVENPGEERVHREVPALEPVVEASIHRHQLPVRRERFEQLRRLVVETGRLGKEAPLLVAQKVTHGNEAFRPGSGAFRRLERGASTRILRHQRGQPRQRQRGAHRLQHETAAVQHSVHKSEWSSVSRNATIPGVRVDVSSAAPAFGACRPRPLPSAIDPIPDLHPRM